MVGIHAIDGMAGIGNPTPGAGSANSLGPAGQLRGGKRDTPGRMLT